MAEQWISAAEGFEIVGDTRAICERLNAGLISARASRFYIGPKFTDDVEVPASFWWAGGESALDQNWKTGDFSTWIEHEMFLRAFGVRFELAGILAMLPIERRASVTRNLSVAGNSLWTSASNAAVLVSTRTGFDHQRSAQELIAQAGLGFLAARAVMAQLSKSKDGDGGWEWQRREWDVASELWGELPTIRDAIINFEAGTVTADDCQAVGGKHIRLMGIHFLLEPIEAVWPPSANMSDASAAITAGGRPRAAFHDELMCAIWKQIYEGDLKPKKQAEIQRAILHWTSVNGHAMSESSARDKARKIWAALSETDNNSQK